MGMKSPQSTKSISLAGPKQIAERWITLIDKCDLLSKDKVWCIYFGLFLKLSWPMQIYEVLITKVEAMEQLISKLTKTW